MKITQEVREFARLQEEKAAAPDADAPVVSEAERGMEEMSKRYRDGGMELYIGAGGRERD